MCKIFSISFHRRHLTNYKLDQISLFNDMAKMLQQYKLGENVYLSKAYTSECWCPLARQDLLATCSGGTLRNAPARRAGASVSFVYLPGATAGYDFAL